MDISKLYWVQTLSLALCGMSYVLAGCAGLSVNMMKVVPMTVCALAVLFIIIFRHREISIYEGFIEVFTFLFPIFVIGMSLSSRIGNLELIIGIILASTLISFVLWTVVGINFISTISTFLFDGALMFSFLCLNFCRV